VALEQVDRLDRLLRSIRNFAHPHRLLFQEMDVRETCAAALRAVEASLQGPKTTVVVGVRPDPLRIVADPERLSEAIQNIVVNAVEAMPEGGTISIQAAPSRQRPGWVDIRVIDSGQGVPPELMSRIFQPFLTTKRTGTGLGLPIVKKIAELHGGFVSLKSVQGKGTTVLLELPAAQPEATRPE
jgi:signal transduction histidine kinase